MWAPICVGLLIATLGQASSGSAGLAIAYGVMLAVVLGIVALRHRSAHRSHLPGDETSAGGHGH